jgi:hypothetical protein
VQTQTTIAIKNLKQQTEGSPDRQYDGQHHFADSDRAARTFTEAARYALLRRLAPRHPSRLAGLCNHQHGAVLLEKRLQSWCRHGVITKTSMTSTRWRGSLCRLHAVDVTWLAPARTACGGPRRRAGRIACGSNELSFRASINDTAGAPMSQPVSVMRGCS